MPQQSIPDELIDEVYDDKCFFCFILINIIIIEFINESNDISFVLSIFSLFI